MLRDFYYPRWRMYFDALDQTFDGKPMPQFDFYAIDEAWTRRHNPYPSEAQGDAVEFAREAMAAVVTVVLAETVAKRKKIFK